MNPSNHSQAASGTPTSAALPHEEKWHNFWKKNRNVIFVGCCALLLIVGGRGAWEIYNIQREKGVEADYAAATTPEKLRAFIHDHAGHRLAGVASLRLADDEYAAGKYTEALADYGTAATTLRDTPLAGRALLGQAIGKLRSGLTADGENQLRQIAADLNQLHAVRAEAAYYLASRAADDGRAEDAKKFADQVQQIDAQGIWAQRALSLRASLPAEAAPATAAPSGGVQLQLPNK